MVPHHNNNNHNLFLTLLVIIALIITFYMVPLDADAAACNRSYLGISETQTEIRVCSDYTIGYDYDLKTPLWVAYSLDRHNLKKLVKRKGSFRSDHRLPRKFRTYSSWYTRTGYDRGHMAPAVSFRYSMKAERSTFVISNAVPQLPGINRGIWRSLEYRVRKHVLYVGDLIVITGPIYSSPIQKLKNKLAIPSAFYKIIIEKSPYKTIAFIIPNKRPSKGYKLKDYIVSIDDVESNTSINFLSSLSATTQNQLESVKSIKSDWPVILK